MLPLPIKTHKALCIFLFSILFFGNSCYAQINLITGISTGFLQNETLEEGVNNYNQSKHSNQLASELKPIKTLLGFNLGIRSRYDLVAIEAGITMRFQNSNAQGLDINNDEFSKKFSLRNNSYYLGTEVFFGSSILSLGGNIAFDKFKIKHSLTGQDSNQIFDQQNGWSSRFFIGLNLAGSGSTKFIIRPFAELDWTGKTLENYFNALGTTAPTDKIDFNQFGISLIFANGAN